MKTLALLCVLATAGWLESIATSDAQSTTPEHALEQGGASFSGLLPTNLNEVADSERLDWTVDKVPHQLYMKEIYWSFPTDTQAFFRDTLVQVVGRTYDLTRDNSNGSKSEASAAGGWVAYRSGLVANTLGLQAAFYTSQPLFAPEDDSGTLLLTPNQGALNVFGQAYARAQIVDQEFRVGRQLLDTPLINPQDNRMVPNTFDGITLDTLPDKDRNYDYAVGYLTAIKDRDSNTFETMSDALAGGDVADRGAAFGMLRYRPLPQLSTVFMDYYLPDFVNTGFAQAEYDFERAKDRPHWVLGANIVDQQTIGEDLLRGGPFHTFQSSGKVQMAYAGWTLFVAGSATGDGSKLYTPFGSNPTYTNMQQVSFDEAGEDALGASATYDFGYAFHRYGLSGLSLGIWDSQGFDQRDPGSKTGIPERNELDVWLQYRPTSGPFQGFRFKTQYSDLWQEGHTRNPQSELRVVLDYTILFRPALK